MTTEEANVGKQTVKVTGAGGASQEIEISNPPSAEDVARVLVLVFPAGAGRSLLSEAQRRGIVAQAVELLRESGA